MRHFPIAIIFLIGLQCCTQKPLKKEYRLVDDYISVKTKMIAINLSDQPLSGKQTETFRLLEEFILNFPLSQNTLILLSSDINLSSAQYDSLFNNLNPTLRNDPYWTSVDVTRSRIHVVETGKLFPEIIFKDTLQRPLKTRSYMGKILFIDFWSSWCRSCRKQFPHLKDIYSKNKAKGFEIIGISMDDKKHDWLKALNEDKLPWPQYCQLVPFQENSLGKRFRIMGLPSNFLIGRNGILIGQDLSPEELETLISKL
jgi:thiol-disulfide isomerase/thioredoxin